MFLGLKKKYSAIVAVGIFVFLAWIGVLLLYDVLDIRANRPSERLEIIRRQEIPQHLNPPDMNETIFRNFLQKNPKIVAAILSEIKNQEKKEEPKEEEKPKEEPKKDAQGEAQMKQPEKPDNGPGEMGKPVHLKKEDLSEEDKAKWDLGWKNYQFNAYISDMISIHRKLPDVRDQKCKEPGRYWTKLPPTVVIICFYNEAWTVLLRTVHAILERSPPHLIKEIVLVDDHSSLEHLKTQLDEYMSQLSPKIKVLHNEKREGLIRSRIIGAEHSTAPILTYLDSHTEPTPGWLEPLLDAVARDPKASAIPTIESINDETFGYSANQCEGLQVGGFDWSLTYTWHPLPKADKIGRHPCDPVRSPTMAGGLFTIGREFFKSIGYYDQKMDVWGGENLEISFKQWMCGGKLLAIPCSHIGHIFRKNSPYASEASKQFGNFVRKNSIRVARVWLDEHANYYYQRTGASAEEAGDVTKQLALREKLHCKSFQWYLDNIYPDLFVPANAIASGELRNIGDGKTCLDSLGGKAHKPVGVYQCHKLGGNQYWSMSKDGEIRQDDNCLDYSGAGDVILYPCHSQEGNQYWVYIPDEHWVKHRVSKKCLSLDRAGGKILMGECQDNVLARWKFDKVDENKVRLLQL